MSKAAVRYAWMFRTAAFVFAAFGAAWLWRFGFTDFDPGHRLWGLGAAVVSMLLAFYLFLMRRFAIGASAVAAAVVGVSAVLFALTVRGPGILFLAALATLCVFYAVLAVRALTEKNPGVR